MTFTFYKNYLYRRLYKAYSAVYVYTYVKAKVEFDTESYYGISYLFFKPACQRYIFHLV